MAYINVGFAYSNTAKNEFDFIWLTKWRLATMFCSMSERGIIWVTPFEISTYSLCWIWRSCLLYDKVWVSIGIHNKERRFLNLNTACNIYVAKQIQAGSIYGWNWGFCNSVSWSGSGLVGWVAMQKHTRKHVQHIC